MSSLSVATSVNKFFSDDHRHLDAVYARFEQALNASQRDRALELFCLFSSALKRHIGWEEDDLFPLFEQHTGMVDSGPTQVMRGEHRIIEKLLVVIAVSIEQHSDRVGDYCGELTYLLNQHNMKEERVLYPAIDDLASDLEIKTLLAELKDIELDTSAVNRLNTAKVSIA